MADFQNIKETVFTTIGVVADKTKELAEKAAEKAKDVSRAAKLNIALATQNATLDKLYYDIGKLYYETKKDDADALFADLVEGVTETLSTIENIKDELASLKSGGDSEASVEVEFTEVSEDEFEKEDKACCKDDDCCCKDKD
ncbi:MAG: hypothetical protein LBM18_03505 [Oscillospiraceae bacterium]|jgi:hypothetical protein|nr:hypothetical protein [Oscillospiraceae bacterium]